MKKPKSRPADKIIEGLNEALDHSREGDFVRPSEMAAGVIHEPGTDVSDEAAEEAAKTVHAIKQIERAYGSVYAISNEDIAYIATALYGRPRASHRDAALKRLYAARENGPIQEPEPVFIVGCKASDLEAAQRQRDFLSRQVDSLVARLAGAHVAAGLIEFNAAQGFIQKEIGPLNAALAQIAAANEAKEATP